MGLSPEPLGRDELGTLYDIARTLNSTLDFDRVLRITMDRVIEFVGADRGFLVLVNQQVSELTFELKFEIAHNNQEQTINESEFEISLSTAYHKLFPSLTETRRGDRLGAGGETPCVVPNPAIRLN
jgi:GAF domain-containing protein